MFNNQLGNMPFDIMTEAINFMTLLTHLSNIVRVVKVNNNK